MNYRVFENSVLKEDDVIFLWGGHIAHKSNETLSKIPLIIFDVLKLKVLCSLVVNNSTYLKISPRPIKLLLHQRINEITAYLISIGYNMRNIFISPVLRDRIAIANLEN